ncbi:MAG: Gfo/Idh/MocA family oxidoreductase [Anaerolineae bacterium]|nr:Gfo/Idh/MocA family oxidoreductase [Anaerolineae bacterium]
MAAFRFLICGTGVAGLHCASIAAADGRAVITGLFDPVEQQLQKARAQFPEAAADSDYERVLETARPDAVIVAGPDHLHAEQAVAALEHGCHVLIEKPLATTSADARRIIEAEKRTGLHVMADHTMRYLYPWKEMALATRAGQIGEVFFVQGDYIHDMSEHYSPRGRVYTPWRADRLNPQNLLLGGGIHAIDLMLWAVDSPVDEVYMYSSHKCVPDFPSEDCFIVIMRFANGTLGKCFVTGGCSGPSFWHRFLECFGRDGTLSQGKLYRRGMEPVQIEDTSSKNVAGGHGWAGSVVDFLNLLEGRIENPIPSRVAAMGVAVCEAGLLSAKTGRPQRPAQF